MPTSFWDQPLDIWSILKNLPNSNARTISQYGGSQMGPPGGYLLPNAPAPLPFNPAPPSSSPDPVLGVPPSPKSLDPARAAAEGFNIPDYIPPAQIAGGSGVYMSKVQGAPVDNSISPAQTAGGSGDYMSRVSGQAGSDPSSSGGQDIFSFFGKPQATDAMTAFGAAMLKGKNFAEGLANASTAVNDVAKQYRPYTPEEINRLMQKAQIERVAKAKAQGAQVEMSRPIYAFDANGKKQLYYPGYDENGKFAFMNTKTQQWEYGIDQATRAEDSGMGAQAKQNVKDATSARDAAVDAFTRMNQADTLLELYDSAGGGAGALNQINRDVSRFFNTDLLGVKVGDSQRIENIVRQMELTQAQTQRGLGQLTEAERQIIRDALPKLEQDPEAFRTVVQTLKRQSERAQTVYTNWSKDKSLQQQYPNINDYYLDWMKSNSGGGGAVSPQSSNSVKDSRPPIDSFFK